MMKMLLILLFVLSINFLRMLMSLRWFLWNGSSDSIPFFASHYYHPSIKVWTNFDGIIARIAFYMSFVLGNFEFKVILNNYGETKWNPVEASYSVRMDAVSFSYRAGAWFNNPQTIWSQTRRATHRSIHSCILIPPTFGNVSIIILLYSFVSLFVQQIFFISRKDTISHLLS